LEAHEKEVSQESMSDWRKLMEERGTRRDKPMKPQVVAWEIGKQSGYTLARSLYC